MKSFASEGIGDNKRETTVFTEALAHNKKTTLQYWPHICICTNIKDEMIENYSCVVGQSIFPLIWGFMAEQQHIKSEREDRALNEWLYQKVFCIFASSKGQFLSICKVFFSNVFSAVGYLANTSCLCSAANENTSICEAMLAILQIKTSEFGLSYLYHWK